MQGFRSSRAQALLIYLAVEAERAHRREHLMALFWPDAPDRVARANLRATLLICAKHSGTTRRPPPACW
ncbi:MAG: hypothetical protein M3Z04_03670 [Chloroflexota bacterium]|nr:hypothetical protein [Chloroflexota bacterium]